MPKHFNETDLDYKQRVIDIKSKSFCGAKWYNATIWLGSGQTTSCHHPPAHAIPLGQALINNPKLIHNTTEKKQDRAMMQQGLRPQGCEYCWKIEDMGSNAVSDRVYKTLLYNDEDLNHAFNLDSIQDVDLQTLEIAFDRTCQFACSYCNPAFSSTWVKDIRTNGPYVDLVSDGRGHFTHEHDRSQLYKFGETNPYVEAFHKWWESDLHRTLKELRITGGEPLMSAETWKLIEWFKNNRGRSKTRLAINSNLGTQVDIDRLLSAIDGVEVDLYTSNESMNLQAEYIRDGLVFDDWANNVERLLDSRKFRGLHVMCTINALCLDSLDSFLEMIANWKIEYGREAVNFSLNILRFPSFQSPLVLPDGIRAQYQNKLLKFFIDHKGDSLIHEFENNQLLRLINYLDIVKTPHDGAVVQSILQRDFKNFYQQYDTRRNKNFVETFPVLKTWYESL